MKFRVLTKDGYYEDIAAEGCNTDGGVLRFFRNSDEPYFCSFAPGYWRKVFEWPSAWYNETEDNA